MKYCILLFVLISCTKKQSNEYSQNIYGEVIKQCNLPVLVDISDADTLTQYASKKAIENWNRSAGKVMFIISKRAKNKILNNKTWNRFKSEQAFTRVKWSGSCIDSAVIQVNNEHFKYYIDNKNDNEYNLTSLIVHELGHVLGLSHSNNTGSVMNPYLDKHENRDTPTKFDINNVNYEYFKKGDIL